MAPVPCRIAALFAAALLTGSCSSGGSPRDASIDSILHKLDAVSSTSFTATYRLTRKLGNVTAEARVTQRPPRVAIVIGNVKFLDGDVQRTCDRTTGRCEPGILAQRVSDVSAGIGFYGPTAATQIRVASNSWFGTTGSRAIAGQAASCVSVGDGTYCVLASGVVALIDRPDVRVELTSYVGNADSALLANHA